jgi:hypothetical protein
MVNVGLSRCLGKVLCEGSLAISRSLVFVLSSQGFTESLEMED